MDKRKLNYRFHNPNSPEALGRELLRICISANMKKVESAVRESVEMGNALRVVAINNQAQVAKLKEDTLFKMPKGQYGGKYYRISNDYIKEQPKEIVLELPSDDRISFTLKHRESLTIKGLPVGTQYTVIEQEANNGECTTTVNTFTVLFR